MGVGRYILPRGPGRRSGGSCVGIGGRGGGVGRGRGG